MKKTLTRVLSLVLVLTMFLSTAPLALATEGDPAPTQATSISLNYSGRIAVPDTRNIEVAVEPTNATVNLQWESSNPAVATVSNGAVTAKKAGTTTITVTDSISGKSDSVEITVIYKASVASTMTMTVGDVAGVPCEIPGLTSGYTLVYRPVDESIVEVEAGKLKAMRPGTTNVNVTLSLGSGLTEANFKETTFTVSVTVEAADNSTYTANLSEKAFTVKLGKSVDLPTKGKLTGLDGLKTNEYSMSAWTTSDNEVTVADGKATGKNVGVATLTATVTSNKEGVTINDDALEITVKVLPNPSLDKTKMDIDFGGDAVAAPTIKGLDGLTKGTDYTVTWESSNKTAVSVVDGTKFQPNSTGKSTLTATIAVTKAGFEGTYTVKCEVTVVADLYIEVTEKIEIAAGDTYTVKTPTLKGVGASNASITDWEYTRVSEGSAKNTSISGTKITASSRTGRDTYKVSATVKKSNGDFVEVPDITVPVSVYAELADITVVLKDSVSSFTFDDESVYTSMKLGLTEVLSSYDSLEELLVDVAKDHMSDRSEYLIDYDFVFSGTVGAGGDLSHASNGVFNDDFTLDSLDDVKYTRDNGTATKSSFSYNVYDEHNMLVMTGDLIIDYKDTAEIVYYCDGDPITFDEDDFEEFWEDYSNTSYKLDYVTFDDMPSTYDGKLYTDEDMDYTAKTNYKFEPNHTGSTNYDLDTVTFDPASTFNGTVLIPFTAVGTNGKKITGTVAITDEEDGGEIEYRCDGSSVTFDEDDFEEFWDDYGTSKSLSYVTFDDLPTASSEGTLYTTTGMTTKVKTSDKFKANYTTSSNYKDLDTVTFKPASGADDTVYIPFTAVGTDDKEVSGTVAIIMSGDSDLTITKLGFRFGQTSAKLDKAIAEEFEDEKDEELEYVTFTIPSKEIGQLFYDYNTAKDTLLDAELITKTTKLYYEAKSSQYSLADVHFFPSECCPKEVTLSYTAYGEDGATYKGTVNLTVITQDSSSKFNDVKGSTGWAADSVDFLNYHGVVNGVTSNTFGPSNKITRGDFMLMLYRAFLKDDYEDTTITANFADVAKGTSDYSKELYQAIGVAKKLGIATGDGTNYYPKKNISREEAMTLIYRTLDELKIDLTVTSSKSTGSFTDYSKVSSYAKDPIKYLISHDIVRGDSGKINPKNNITRAEMAVILHRVLTF